MGKHFFNLNSGGIFGPKNEKCKYSSNVKTNSRLVISMTENTLVTIVMSCVEILTKGGRERESEGKKKEGKREIDSYKKRNIYKQNRQYVKKNCNTKKIK